MWVMFPLMAILVVAQDSQPATVPASKPVSVVKIADSELPGQRVVFLLDLTGSLVVSFDEIRKFARKSIAGLNEGQNFALVAYSSDSQSDEPVIQISPEGMREATEESKAEIFDWIDRLASIGGGKPDEALRTVGKLNPDVVCFISDGFFEDTAIKAARKFLPDRTRVACLVFDELQRNDRTGQWSDNVRRMQRIALQHKGICRVMVNKEWVTPEPEKKNTKRKPAP